MLSPWTGILTAQFGYAPLLRISFGFLVGYEFRGCWELSLYLTGQLPPFTVTISKVEDPPFSHFRRYRPLGRTLSRMKMLKQHLFLASLNLIFMPCFLIPDNWCEYMYFEIALAHWITIICGVVGFGACEVGCFAVYNVWPRGYYSNYPLPWCRLLSCQNWQLLWLPLVC